MVFEEFTHEKILEETLNRVKDPLDKRTSSVIYQAIAPVTYTQSEIYAGLDWILDQVFFKNANYENAERWASNQGFAPLPSSYAIVRGEFDTEIPIGNRFSCDPYNYVVISEIEPLVYRLQCETAGAAPNDIISGRLIPIDYVPGLKSSNITELLVPGEDKEELDVFKERVLNSLKFVAFGWNHAQYIDEVSKIPGVGMVKCADLTPETESDPNCQVCITTSNPDGLVPSDELLTTVQEYLRNNVPIDHNPIVTKCTESPVTISCSVTLESGYTLESVRPAIEKSLNDLIDEVNSSWGDSDHLTLRISAVTIAIISAAGVLDVSDVKINNLTYNYETGTYDVLSLGELVAV